MSERSGPPGESGWVVEPAAMEIQIAVGPEAELTPALHEAIDDLMRALEAQTEPEVAGFATKCTAPVFGFCNPQSKTDCRPKIWMPCVSKQVCNVGPELA